MHWRGRSEFAGGLDDHAAVAGGLLALFEVDPEPRWLDGARAILQAVGKHFDAGDGGYWNVADDGEALVVRTRTAFDAALPSGTALAAAALLRGGLLLGDRALYDRGVAAVQAHASVLTATPLAASALAAAAHWHLAGPREVVVVGEPGDAQVQRLLAAAAQAAPAGVVVNLHAGNRDALVARSPLFAGKELRGGKPCAYVCRFGVCAAPVADVAALREALR